jgi:hypothetical protein
VDEYVLQCNSPTRKQEWTMNSFPQSILRFSLLLLSAILLAISGNAVAQSDQITDRPTDRPQAQGHWIVGAWYLALDTEPFGLPPGTPPLSGLAIFNADGTLQFADAGDFGQMGFTGKHLTQYGSWRRAPRNTVVAVTLFLEANNVTAEVERWTRARFRFRRTDHRDVVAGLAVEISNLECDLPVPLSAISCPDPIEHADDFVVSAPPDVPILLRRIRP